MGDAKLSLKTQELIKTGTKSYVPVYAPREMIISHGKGSRVWDLDDNKYTYNSWSLNTNYNMEVWRAGKVKLLAVTGLHLDYILYESDAEEDFRHFKPSEDPLEILVRFGALRKLNIGCNMGGRLVYTANQWSYSLNYTYAPRLLKMGKFEKEIDVGNLGVMNGISVKEKVSFITLGVGYNLKGTK